LYDPFNPAHWQVWAGVGGSSGGRFGGYNNNGGGGYNNAPQAIPSNIDEAARSAAVNLAHRMGLRDIPDDGGRAQGGNLWRYTAMVEKGLIKPPSEGGKGWKSADELRTVTCYVSRREEGWQTSRRVPKSARAELSDLLFTAMWGEGSLRDGLSEPGKSASFCHTRLCPFLIAHDNASVSVIVNRTQAKPGDRGGLNRRRKWQEGDPPL
jgi:hypothetical protein